VTDSGNWQPPVVPQAQPADSGAPWASTSPPPAAQNSWRPPPRPGLIPLQPLSFGTILGSSFRVIRRNPGPTLGLSLLTYGTTTLLALIIYGYFYLQALSLFPTGSAVSQEDSRSVLYSLAQIAWAIVPFALSLVASAIMQGIISLEVARGSVGERLTAGGLWRRARGRIAPLIGWGFLIIAAVFVLSIVLFVIYVIAVAVIASSDNIAFSVIVPLVLGLLLFGVFIVLVVWIGTKTVFVPSLLVIERLTLGAAIARSWRLTKGYFWRTFGTLLLINVIISLAGQIISTPIAFIGLFAVGLLNPNGGSIDSITSGLAPVLLASSIVSVIVGAVGLVAQSAAIALTYIDVRMRKEGLDLELMHYVEGKHGTAGAVDNPFERTATSAPPADASTQSPWG
jgi:hypothetical protein